MKKAAIYARFSSSNQREESIDAQVRAIRDFADKNDYEIVQIYADEAKSATTDNRPEFLRMIKESEKGMFDAVVVHKIDRFSRDRYDSAFYKRTLKKNRVRLISVLENLDDSPESVILESVLEGMAEYYSKNLSREVMKGLKENALKAQHNGGLPPLGYNYDKNTKEYVINETEKLSVELIYKLYLEGYGYGLIADKLNDKGLKTKTGKSFSKNSVRDILLNEKYTGTFVYNKRAAKSPTGAKANRTYKDDADIIRIPGAMPQIINEHTFKTVQDKLTANKRAPRLDGANYYMLSGLLVCGECNSSYSGNSYTGTTRNGVKRGQYTCVGRKKKSLGCTNVSIRQDKLEEYVASEIEDKIFSAKALNKVAKKMTDYVKAATKNAPDETSKVSAAIAELDVKINKLLDAVIEGLIDKSVIRDRMDQYQAEKSMLQEKLHSLSGRDYAWVDADKVKGYILSFKDMLESEDAQTKRKAIEAFLYKVVIHKDTVEVIFKIDFLNSHADMGKVGGDEPRITFTLSTLREHIYI